jgi:excisionase family DNA binding protein
MSSVVNGQYKTVTEAADILGLTVQRVRQLINSSQLKAEAVHERLWIIPTKELERFRKQKRPSGVHKDKRAG